MRTINREEIVTNSGHVVVLKGGQSSEREISLLSGGAVFDGLVRLGVNADVIDVGENLIEQIEALQPDLVFNVLHGKGGEDGVIQGLLEVMAIPYTGSGVLSSALAMDKTKTKLLWQQLDLPTADFVQLKHDSDWADIIQRLGSVVVKPVNGGSSIGIAIVATAQELEKKYLAAIKLDPEVMAEQYIDGKEFSVGVMDEQLLPAIEMETKREFFTFDAKYIDDDTVVICPPNLSDAKLDELNSLVRDAYDSLDCKGLARVDVMQDTSGKFYLLELNTVPGMTEHSFIPMAAAKVGISFDDLLLRVLDSQLARD